MGRAVAINATSPLSGPFNITLSGGDASKIKVGFIIANVDYQNSGFLLLNNTVRFKYARGMLIKVIP